MINHEASEGVLNQLGRPALDRLTVLVREAVQNSWDARDPASKSITFGLNGWTLTASQRKALKESIFAKVPPKLGIKEMLAGEALVQGLAVWDRGTTGLGGPTRADVVGDYDEADDFVDFLRNIGRPPDKKLSGGTFGYGKAALYLASQVSTICVHTHCTFEGKPVQRFIAAALGPSYKHQKANYTGRHWWGQRDGWTVEPVLGRDADALAASIGMPAFEEGARGTSIVILQPYLDEKPLLEAMNAMILGLLWNFWPKLLSPAKGAPASIKFEVLHEGAPIPVPDPRRFPPLQGFVKAMENLKSYQALPKKPPVAPAGIYPIACERPRKHLGILSLERFPFQKRAQLQTGEDALQWPPSKRACHVALMRQPELVVKYVTGPELPTEILEYAGVFLTDVEIDPVFARSEPPTHDDWVHEGLESRHERTFVKVCLRNINETLKSFVAPPGLAARGGEAVPLGAFAEKLGDLLPLTDNRGDAGKSSPSPRPDDKKIASSRRKKVRQRRGDRGGVKTGVIDKDSVSRTRARVTILEEPRLERVGSTPTLGVVFEVTPARSTSSTLIKVKTVVILEGNAEENDPPAGAVVPNVLQWLAPDGKRIAGGEELKVLPQQTGPWKVSVSIPPDAVIQVALRASSVSEP